MLGVSPLYIPTKGRLLVDKAVQNMVILSIKRSLYWTQATHFFRPLVAFVAILLVVLTMQLLKLWLQTTKTQLF
ncbi:hypothetical protein [Nostoc sp. LPT]|uniref:hypothetical protein n=1 Tax=Nostoc sp. LPT TaxID=2815387 RepID=UPI0025F91D0E|nr:hypothetical protein [Nostoc sp. LPT]